jgi:hypothetical protein
MNTTALASPQVSNVTGSSLTVTEPGPAEPSQLPEQEWTRADLARFIHREIARVNGPQLPVLQADEIITGFYARFGFNGVKIVRYVFGTLGGMWRGAPVTVRRFAPGQDMYFAEPILREISS